MTNVTEKKIFFFPMLKKVCIVHTIRSLKPEIFHLRRLLTYAMETALVYTYGLRPAAIITYIYIYIVIYIYIHATDCVGKPSGFYLGTLYSVRYLQVTYSLITYLHISMTELYKFERRDSVEPVAKPPPLTSFQRLQHHRRPSLLTSLRVSKHRDLS